MKYFRKAELNSQYFAFFNFVDSTLSCRDIAMQWFENRKIHFLIAFFSIIHFKFTFCTFFDLCFEFAKRFFLPIIVTAAAALFTVIDFGVGYFSNIRRVRTPFGIPGKKLIQR
uniref:(northern house mosquito) hypothetical protein n=1 Tax=Culex pipiens TaxID=7175 RepID=A0A8D8ADF6_CULPI